MFGGEGSMYRIEYKFFVYLGSYSRPNIIGIKVGWFGLIFELEETYCLDLTKVEKAIEETH